jgi:hypothetical protein
MATYKTGTFPGYDVIQNSIKSGQAEIITAYPITAPSGGLTYSDTPGKYLNQDISTELIPSTPTPVLKIGDTIYPPDPNWRITPVTKSVQVGTQIGEYGDTTPITQDVPTGSYRLGSRYEGAIFNEMLVGEGAGGKITSYNPNIYQTGPRDSGMFGGGFFGNLFSGLSSIAAETAPVWMAALGANALSGALGSAAAGGGEALGAVLPEAGFGEISAAELANLGYDSSWINSLGATGLEPVIPDGISINPVTPPSSITPTELPSVDAVTTPNVPSVSMPNLEGGDLGMTELQAQEQFYRDIGIDPTTLKDLPPATTAEINQILQAGPNITPSDLSKLKNIVSTANTAKNLLSSTGLLGGTAAALAGVAGANALMNKPSTYTPPSQAGTSSGMANYSPEYYQQIQQNYNRMFPTAPTDVTTPLQSWYATKFVPDTNISNKLFGV